MRIGIDLGGTKIEVIALDSMGVVCLRRRVSTPTEGYERTLKKVVDLIKDIETELGKVCSVGIGIPGAVSSVTGKIKNANSTCLIGQHFDKDLSIALRREIRLSNDANCFVLSEAIDGAGSDGKVVFGVIIGTGVGAGIALNGNIWTGPNAIAGEWGHNPLPWAEGEELYEASCYCGKKRCIETFLSGPGLARDFHAVTGRLISPQEIVVAAEFEDAVALSCLMRYEHRLARGLAHVINILDPDVIVLGGGMSNITRLYTNVPKLWEKFVFSDSVATRLVSPKHGDSSGVRGAAWLWPPL